MRNLLTLCGMVTVIALGYWAYHQAILTQQAERRVERLQAEIGAAREKLAILNAEWAYLNRPDRLRELGFINFERLGLLPMSPDQFGRATQIPYPLPDLPEAAAALLGDEVILGSASVGEEQIP